MRIALSFLASTQAPSHWISCGQTRPQIAAKRKLVKRLRKFRMTPPVTEAGFKALLALKAEFKTLDPDHSQVFMDEADSILEAGKARAAQLDYEHELSDVLDLSVDIDDDSDEDDEEMMAYAEELDINDESGFLSDMEDEDGDDEKIDDEDDDAATVIIHDDED